MSSSDPKFTICTKCRHSYRHPKGNTFYCAAPDIDVDVDWVTGSLQEVLCSDKNTNGDCYHYQAKPPSILDRLIALLPRGK